MYKKWVATKLPIFFLFSFKYHIPAWAANARIFNFKIGFGNF